MVGAFAGTLPYMAPEQVEGHPADARTDIFAFGALLYELITGRRAFSGETPASVVAAILGPLPPAPSQIRSEIPRPLDRIISTCLARAPDDRWQNIVDVMHELRWVAMDLKDGATSAVSQRPQSRWRLHAAWSAVVAVLAMSFLLFHRGATPKAPPPPNPVPVIVLMDSPLPDRVYDPRTAAEGGTNADDITDALRDLSGVIHKENTSAMWHREEQLVDQNPDLIVSHLSCFLDGRVADGQEKVHEHLFSLAENRLIQFFGYAAAANDRTQFLVYSRGSFVDSIAAKQWVKDAEARFPAMRGRLHTFSVPGGQEGEATFRNPNTARLMRERVQQVLALR
jgi:serine/threonine protein kinase